MTTAAFLGFVAVATVGIVTPGLDTMLVLRHALVGGRRAGLATVVGITLGCLVWGTASIAGLAALLTTSQLAYNVVRLLGAAYLLWLGGTALWNSLRHNRKPDDAPGLRVRVSSWSALRAGVVTNLLNPKVGVFYISLLPQFLPTGPGTAGWGVLLVAVHLSIGLLWLPMLVWVAGRARTVLQRNRVRAWLDRTMAAVFIGLGLKLAVEGR